MAATITHNEVEAIIASSAGTVAGSIALIGFGLDSVIEVSSAAAVAGQFSATDPERRTASRSSSPSAPGGTQQHAVGAARGADLRW